MAHQSNLQSTTDKQESTEALSGLPDAPDDEQRVDIDELASIAAALITARLHDRLRTML